MKIIDRWRVCAWFFLILIFTVSSVALTITLLEWNMQRAQRALGRNALKNESLSRYPFTFLQELTTGRIQKDAYAEVGAIVSEVLNQYLFTDEACGVVPGIERTQCWV